MPDADHQRRDHAHDGPPEQAHPHPHAGEDTEVGPRSTGLRHTVERASLPVLERAARGPRWLPFVVLFGLILGGSVLGGGVGLALVLLGLVIVLWMLYLTWPHLRAPERLMRVAVLAVLLLIPLTQFVSR